MQKGSRSHQVSEKTRSPHRMFKPINEIAIYSKLTKVVNTGNKINTVRLYMLVLAMLC